jgi:hypothetical protein
MAIKQDGTEAFAISTPTFSGLVVENFSITETGERVDLNDSEGKPLGSVTIPGREEFSATLQLGTGSPLTVGSEVSYGGRSLIITEAGEEETQADYVRVNVSGYVKIN